MRVLWKYILTILGIIILFGSGIAGGGCSGMSTRDKNTAVGAGVGGVAGSVLTGGSTAGTIGGAAVGGIIGHQVEDP
jgi:osmotically inducible lipoprotein OsmB